MLDVVKTVRPVVENLGDDEGTFPRRSKLVRPLLVYSEHKVSFLKCSTFDIASMELTQILLRDGLDPVNHLSTRLASIPC